jgi:PST family polysaccharide transporter
VVGLYHQARGLALSGSQAARPLLQLSFNLYARAQDDPERLARAHRVVNYALARGSGAIAAIWLVFPEETVRLLLGEAWLPAAAMLRWLALYGVLFPLSMSAKQLLLARGEAIATVRVRLAQALVFLPGVALAAANGSVAGVVVALTGASALGLALANHANARSLETRLRSALAAPLLAAAATWLGFDVLARAGLAAAIPWPLRPLLASLAFGLLLLLVERRTLVAELRGLRGALRGGVPGRVGAEPPVR